MNDRATTRTSWNHGLTLCLILAHRKLLIIASQVLSVTASAVREDQDPADHHLMGDGIFSVCSPPGYDGCCLVVALCGVPDPIYKC